MTGFGTPTQNSMNEQSAHQSEGVFAAHSSWSLNVADLSVSAPCGFNCLPGKQILGRLAGEISARSVSKFAFRGEVQAVSPEEWHLSGRLSATVVQQCVVSLGDVRTRIDVSIKRRFLADQDRVYPGLECPVPNDDTVELLSSVIDLYGLTREVLLLEIPSYPRLEGATVPDSGGSNSGQDQDQADGHPFAVLSEFRERMAK